MGQSITWFGLVWCALPVIIVTLLFYYWQGEIKEILIASGRMVLQLVAIGYILVFLFDHPSNWIILCVLLLMMVIASWIAIRPVRHHQGFYFPAMIALAISVLLHLSISIFLVIDTANWNDPRLLIPLAGMYFANSMNTVSLAAERYHAELHNNVAELTARKAAFQAAMIPQINGLLAVGLVALPGMMTGQILSGVSPLIAVRYQILIMTMILGSSGVAAAIMLWQLSSRELNIVKKNLVDNL